MSSDDKLEITDGSRTFSLDRKEVLALELALNKSSYGKTYSKLGDYFFDFVRYPKGNVHRPSSYLNVEKEQYDVLSKIHIESN